MENFVAYGYSVRRRQAIRRKPQDTSANHGGQRYDQSCFHKFTVFWFQVPLFVRRRRISSETRAQNRGVKNERPMSGSGHNTGVEKGSQIRKAQCRAYSGPAFARKGEEK
jgi:hypothetical protein